MKSPVRFFVGANDYSSLTTLNQWRQAFVKKYSDSSLIGLDAAMAPDQLLLALQEAKESQSLFAEVKLVVIRNVFNITDDQAQQAVLALWGQAKEGELVVLNWQRGLPDKRRTLYKEAQKLVKNGQAIWQEFAEPDRADRTGWLQQFLAKRQTKIEPAAANYLLEQTAGLPLWSLASDAALLSTVADGLIDSELAAAYVDHQPVIDNFGVTDKLLTGNKRDVLASLATLTLARNPNLAELISLWGALIWQLRTMLLLKSLLEEGVSSYDLGKESGTNPYVVRKLTANLNKFSLAQLKSLLVRAAELELAVKNGQSDLVWAIETVVWQF